MSSSIPKATGEKGGQSMSKKRIEILIVIVVAALLLVLGCVFFVFGCKDEAEAMDADIADEPELTLELVDTNNFWVDYEMYPTTITFPRYTFEGIDFKKEITLKLGGGYEIVCNVTEKLFLERMYCSLSGKAPIEEITLRFKESDEPTWRKGSGDSLILSEPNEPEVIGLTVDFIDISITEPNEPIQELTKCFEDLLGYTDRLRWTTLIPSIPTWPDYIELEKDLMVLAPRKNPKYHSTLIIPKGTKIYFSDKD